MTFNLADLFERVAHSVPDRQAVVCGDRRLSYHELDQRADRVAAALAAAGVGQGDRISIALRNSAEYLELMLGAFKLAAVPVNLNYRYQPAELRHVLGDSGAKLVIHEPDLSDRLEQVVGSLEHPPVTIARGRAYESWLEEASATAPPVERSGDDLYILYTGGTTGGPKGVLWRHEDIFFAAMGGGRRRGDPIEHPDQITDELAETPNRVLPASPLMHGTAHWFAFLTLFAGSCVVLADDTAFDAARLLDLVDTESVSYLVVVGNAFAGPIADALDAEPDRWDLTSLTVIISGGATLSAGTRGRLLEQLPWVIVVDSYGTSETGGQASLVYTSGMDDTVGPPRFEPRAHTVVLDDDLVPVGPGQGRTGRIGSSGHLPLGYHGDPDRTAATFPTVDGVRWALTGDRATVADDGTIVLLGRGSHTINSGGEKIHPEEVENVLMAHPDVSDAVVVGVPDERWGERVGAVVATRAGRTVPVEALVEHCRTRLAGYKAPRTMVMVERIRWSEPGKPDHQWAQEMLAAPTPGGATAEGSQSRR